MKNVEAIESQIAAIADHVTSANDLTLDGMKAVRAALHEAEVCLTIEIRRHIDANIEAQCATDPAFRELMYPKRQTWGRRKSLSKGKRS